MGLFHWFFFPIVFLSTLASASYFLANDADPQFCMMIHMAAAALIVAIAERFVPHERSWSHSHGDVRTDILHFFVSNAGTSVLTDMLVLPMGVVIATTLSQTLSAGVWPSHWTLVSQGLLAVALAELPYYWWHRLSHEVEFLWRFHSVHHSAPRLYWLNAVRFHPIDAFIGYAIQAFPLVALGAGPEVLAWHAIFLGTHGPFQHANLELRLGPLNWLFSMAELHRWHHSPRVEEGNTNYGGNLILWDVLFRTRYLPRDRVAAKDIGVGGAPHYPQSYLAQLAAPFRWASIHESTESEPEDSAASSTSSNSTGPASDLVTRQAQRQTLSLRRPRRGKDRAL